MADAMALDQTITQGATGGVAATGGSADTSKVQVPGYVKGQLGSDGEALLKEIEKDPGLAAKLPKGIPELFKAWRTSQQDAGAVRVPAKDAPREAWDQFYKAVGRPDGPDGYQLQKPDNLPKGLPYDENLEKWFRAELFEAGVPNERAAKMFTDWNALQTQRYNAVLKARAEKNAKDSAQAIDALKGEYKDDYPRKMQLMGEAMARYMTPDLMEVLNNTRTMDGLRITDNPKFMKAWVSIGEKMADDSMIGSQAGAERRPTQTEWNRPGLPSIPGPDGKPRQINLHPEMEQSNYYGGKYRVRTE